MGCIVEPFFETDYDPVQNSAGWQWAASVGSDAAPYFRIMDPYAQQARHDPLGAYVKRWVPELREVAAVDLPRWEDARVRERYASAKYPPPIVPSHAAASREARRRFASVK